MRGVQRRSVGDSAEQAITLRTARLILTPLSPLDEADHARASGNSDDALRDTSAAELHSFVVLRGWRSSSLTSTCGGGGYPPHTSVDATTFRRRPSALVSNGHRWSCSSGGPRTCRRRTRTP